MKVSTLLLFAERVTVITAACVHESQFFIRSRFICNQEKPVYQTPTLSVSHILYTLKTTGHHINVSRSQLTSAQRNKMTTTKKNINVAILLLE